jgi:hypothetical protein
MTAIALFTPSQNTNLQAIFNSINSPLNSTETSSTIALKASVTQSLANGSINGIGTKGVLKDAQTKVYQISDDVMRKLREVASIPGQIGNAVVSKAQEIFNTIKNAIKQGYLKVTQFPGFVLQAIKDLPKNVVNALQALQGDFANKLYEAQRTAPITAAGQAANTIRATGAGNPRAWSYAAILAKDAGVKSVDGFKAWLTKMNTAMNTYNANIIGPFTDRLNDRFPSVPNNPKVLKEITDGLGLTAPWK